jgi:hypothetical protein
MFRTTLAGVDRKRRSGGNFDAMVSVDWPTLLIGAIPGCIALAGVAVSYGRAMQRISAVERAVEKLSDLGARVSTIEERTKNTADNMNLMRADVSKITGFLLDEGRSFSAPKRTSSR